MRKLTIVGVITLGLLVGGSATLSATERPTAFATSTSADAASIYSSTVTNALSAPILAQYSNDNGYSGSTRVRIPIKLIGLIIMGIIGLGGWVVKKVFA